MVKFCMSITGLQILQCTDREKNLVRLLVPYAHTLTKRLQHAFEILYMTIKQTDA